MPNKARQSEIHALIQRADAANAAFMNGDAAGSFAMNRHSTDFLIMTPFGAHSAGSFFPTPDQTAAMAQRFLSATAGFEVIAAIERRHGIVDDLPPNRTRRCA